MNACSNSKNDRKDAQGEREVEAGGYRCWGHPDIDVGPRMAPNSITVGQFRFRIYICGEKNNSADEPAAQIEVPTYKLWRNPIGYQYPSCPISPNPVLEAHSVMPEDDP